MLRSVFGSVVMSDLPTSVATQARGAGELVSPFKRRRGQ